MISPCIPGCESVFITRLFLQTDGLGLDLNLTGSFALLAPLPCFLEPFSDGWKSDGTPPLNHLFGFMGLETSPTSN